jgi:hypothetical protein
MAIVHPTIKTSGVSVADGELCEGHGAGGGVIDSGSRESISMPD